MPQIDVVIPEIKLALSDLAYMRGLTADGQRCFCSNKSRDKLIFMGLVEHGSVEPTPAEIREWQEKRAALIAKIDATYKKRDYSALNEATNSFYYHDRKKPESRKDYILTKAGKEVLAKGKARSTTALKADCA